MAEVVGLVASVIAVAELAGRIATICKSYIDSVKDYPKDLRLIYVEIGSLKVIFEGLNFLDLDDPAESATLNALRGSDGPVECCKGAIQELEKLFSSGSATAGPKRKRGKPPKLQAALTSLAWPLKADKAQKLLKEIMQHKSTISVALQGQLMCDVQQVRRQLHEISVYLNASEKRKVVDWLRGPVPQTTNSWSLHDAAQRLYELGTGNWVFQTPEWESWMNRRERSIWLHGIPGAGKTVLVSYIIERMRRICEAKDKQTCIYYYCYHGHNQDETEPFLRWVVSQLIQEQNEVPHFAWKAYEDGSIPHRELLLDTLDQILSSYDLVYIGIDALDESRFRERLLSLLETFMTEPRFSKIQVFATSREYEDIRRRMQIVSQPLSMSNSFVEADIRLYVAAKIKESVKFQRWPQDLQNEVQDTLSTGASGMFRWVVCQLDILRRLHHQSKIREAIKSLPTTLDETYERIFSYIAIEERDLVRHALHWTCFHNYLWNGAVPLPAQVLLDSYTIPEVIGDIPCSDDLLSDMETLKDICGCLISFSDENTGEKIATIAHYTVREFLESSRAPSQLSANWVKINQESSYSVILRNIFEFATFPEASPLCITDDRGPGPLHIQANSSLQEYCLACSVWSLSVCEELIQPYLAFRLLDPLAPHYYGLQQALKRLSMEDPEVLTDVEVPFWYLSWTENCQSSSAIILVHLVIMQCYELARAYTLLVDMEKLMHENLGGEVSSMVPWIGKNNRFWGNIVEVLFQIREPVAFKFIQETSTTLISYHNLLPSLMASCPLHTEVDQILENLLDNGADPDPKGFQVTPLQIAVYTRSLSGVCKLLEAGVDPNNSGNPLGIAWSDECSVLYPYSKLHGYSPLDILSRFEPLVTSLGRGRVIGAEKNEIEQALLCHGAAAIQSEATLE